MALKDWKKATSFIWVNKKEDTALALSKKGFEHRYVYNISRKQPDGHFLVGEKLGRYGTRTQASAYAKSYMRRH